MKFLSVQDGIWTPVKFHSVQDGIWTPVKFLSVQDGIWTPVKFHSVQDGIWTPVCIWVFTGVQITGVHAHTSSHGLPVLPLIKCDGVFLDFVVPLFTCRPLGL